MINTEKLIDSFILENEQRLLSKRQILELSKKVFSLNPFALVKRNPIFKSFIDSNSLLFGLMNSRVGIIITPKNCCYCVANGVVTFDLKDFLVFNVENRGEEYFYIVESGKKGFLCKKEEFNILEKLKVYISKHYEEIEDIKQSELQNEQNKEKNRVQKLKSSIFSTIENLDKNNDGQVDLIENEFNKLFSKYQKQVINIDKNYVHQFVKISNFIKTKKQNTQKIFESIRDTSSLEELDERVKLLKNQIYSYELLVFHSINMIGALVSDDLITFYEIYESFDKLGIYNSNWENEVSEKLTNIGDKLDDLMYSIYNMEQNIVSELSHLSYITQESFDDLNRSVTTQLKSVESSINMNNLLTGIQTYQLYKINKNTKGLR